MTNSIVPSDISSLLDQWIESEQNGVEFPVPFEAAWRMAEYSTKASAKRELKSLKKGKQFVVEDSLSTGRNGRPSERIMLSMEGFEAFRLKAKYRAKSSEHPKVVYIMQCSQTMVIKIGISNDPLARLATIQTGYPFKLNIVRVIQSTKKLAKDLEKELHNALADFRLEGEWFDALALYMIGA